MRAAGLGSHTPRARSDEHRFVKGLPMVQAEPIANGGSRTSLGHFCEFSYRTCSIPSIQTVLMDITSPLSLLSRSELPVLRLAFTD